MTRRATTPVLLVICWAASCAADTGSADPGAGFIIYRGMSDASAAVALDDATILVADDETNALRVYRTAGGGPPVSSHDLTGFLGIDPKNPEADIEGAARVGHRVYWVTSHGRNKDGKPRPNRYRFFATTVRACEAGVEVKEVGVPYWRLVDALIGADSTRDLGLERATRLHDGKLDGNLRERLAPKQEGLNIEGLCATPDGATLYLGLRNPRVPSTEAPGGRAIVVPLFNAAAVVEKGEMPQFGPPILWDLAGLGIRSMVYSAHHKAFFVVAGPHDDRPGFALYRWSGDHARPPVFLRRLDADGPAWQPEALVACAASARLLALSDDGAVPVKVSGPAECLEGEYRPDGTCDNKFLRDEARRFFRGRWLTP